MELKLSKCLIQPDATKQEHLAIDTKEQINYKLIWIAAHYVVIQSCSLELFNYQ